MAEIAGDIIDRGEVLETLRRRLAQLEAAQKLAHLGSWSWEVQSDEVTWSEELCRIAGLEPGDSPRGYAEFIKLVHPDDHTALKQAVARSFDSRAQTVT